MRRAITVLAGLAALAVLAGFGGRWWPPLDLVAAFRLHLAALGVVLALVAAAGRHWRAAGLALGTAAVAVTGLGPALGPALEPAARPGGERALTVFYGNVQDGNAEVGALTDRLLAAGADVLVTSETPAALAERLSAFYPHRLVSGSSGTNKRTAIWSRHPLRDGRLYLNNTAAPTGASAVVDLGGVEVGLIGGHFSRPTEAVQPRQVAGLGEIAAALPRPLIVVADFNAAPWTATLARAARLTGTRLVGGYRVTWRGVYDTPLGRLPEPWGHQIDHLLVSEGVGVAAIATVPMPGSDHAGLLARLRLPPR